MYFAHEGRRPILRRLWGRFGYGAFLFLFRDERESHPMSQASCLQLAEEARNSSRGNTHQQSISTMVISYTQ